MSEKVFLGIQAISGAVPAAVHVPALILVGTAFATLQRSAANHAETSAFEMFAVVALRTGHSSSPLSKTPFS